MTQFQSNRPEFDEFEAHFKADIEPFLRAHEEERQIRLKWAIRMAIALTPVTLFLTWYYGFASYNSDEDALGFLALPVGGFMAVMMGLRNKTKNYLVESISGYLGWDYTSNAAASKLTKRLNQYGLLPNYKYASISDIFHGNHEGWPFQFGELHLEVMRGSGDNRRRVTVFRGFLLSFRMAHPVLGATVISHSPIKTKLFLKEPLDYHAHYTVNHADGDKQKVFVRSSDMTAIETILCTRFKAAIAELEENVNQVNLACLLDHDALHIPIKSNDKFEIDWLFESMNDPSRVQKMVSEFSTILNLLEIVLKRRTCSHTGQCGYPNFRKGTNPTS